MNSGFLDVIVSCCCCYNCCCCRHKMMLIVFSWRGATTVFGFVYLQFSVQFQCSSGSTLLTFTCLLLQNWHIGGKGALRCSKTALGCLLLLKKRLFSSEMAILGWMVLFASVCFVLSLIVLAFLVRIQLID